MYKALSCYQLYFPATADTTTGAHHLRSGYCRGRGQHVLIVDNIADQCQIATSILEELSYTVQRVASGEDAVSYLQSYAADFVLLDMITDPGINGLETYRRILQFNPKQRDIIASGFSRSDLIRKAIAMGARSYLKRPYRIEAIAKAVAEGLAEY